MREQELLQEKNLDFKLSGRDLLVKCLNPEHEDTNPSMRIDNVTGIFHFRKLVEIDAIIPLRHFHLLILNHRKSDPWLKILKVFEILWGLFCEALTPSNSHVILH